MSATVTTVVSQGINWIPWIIAGIGVVAAIVAGLHSGNRQTRQETIQTQGDLIEALESEIEFSKKKREELEIRLVQLETRIDLLQSDFAAKIATAVVLALPDVLAKNEFIISRADT